MIELLHIDCMEYMKGVPDKFFDLAICDPQYGILENMGDRLDKYGTKHKTWDAEPPTDEYFDQLKRISVNRIVWGGNYFPQLWGEGCKGFIFWYKHQPVKNWAAGELAYTSFDKPAMCFDYMCYGGVNGDANRTHPTQKPVKLYKWVLHNYANEGDKIFDSHGGSMSIAIACHDMNFDLTLCEIDEEYYRVGVKRYENHRKQLKLFQ